MFCALLFKLMPYPKYFTWLLGTRYIYFYHKVRDCAAHYHRAQLRELDLEFKVSEASQKPVRLRQEAREQGIGPADPNYPALGDVLNFPKLDTELES